MKKRIQLLVLAHDQFGYSITKFKHCEYASKKFDITYVGWDYGLPRLELPNVKVVYVSRNSSILKRNFQLLAAFHQEIKNGYDVVIANYARGISFLPILNPRVTFLAYIDTLGVMPNKNKRKIFNSIVKTELSFFKNVAVISNGVAKKLSLKKFSILPLGGEAFSTNLKMFQNLHLLYVGSLDNRNIIDCVKGFHEFLIHQDKVGSSLPHHFTIIGDSPAHELLEINQYIEENNLGGKITTTGYLPQNKLFPFFEKSNVGVSYIPLYPYYQFQPPTKTYEYLVSGLAVLATATSANNDILIPSDGILIDDNPTSFYKGILKIWENKNDFNSVEIIKNNQKYTWKNVINDNFIPLIVQLAKSRN